MVLQMRLKYFAACCSLHETQWTKLFEQRLGARCNMAMQARMSARVPAALPKLGASFSKLASLRVNSKFLTD